MSVLFFLYMTACGVVDNTYTLCLCALTLLGMRGTGGHDATRRMKNELLTQMEGCTTGNQHVMLIGATNVPQVCSSPRPPPLAATFERTCVSLPCIVGGVFCMYS